MIFEFDDFGANHIISDMCQTHDCRDKLNELKSINPDFKCTMFAVPGEMTPELINWCRINADWVELAVHGFFHTSNYECEKLSYEEFDEKMLAFADMFEQFFVKVFRAPGWQISTDALKWLADNEWLVADQGYNDERRPDYMYAYVNYDGQFKYLPRMGEPTDVEAQHGHVWNVGEKGNAPNGIYEDFDNVSELVRNTKQFKFVSELKA